MLVNTRRNEIVFLKIVPLASKCEGFFFFLLRNAGNATVWRDGLPDVAGLQGLLNF